MAPDQFQQAWQTHSSQTRVTVDSDLLIKEVQRSLRAFQLMILWRDLREMSVSLLLIPVWLRLGIVHSLPWTWYLEIPSLLWITGFLLVDRKRYPQQPCELGESLLHNVKKSLTQVEHQIWLLRNVLWWYLLPLGLPILIFFADTTFQIASRENWLEALIFGGLLFLIVFAVNGATYLLNRFAERNHLEPQRQALLKLIASLEGTSTMEDSRDLFDVVSALNERNQNWVQKWNRIVPSWREAILITLATLGGALCGLWFPINEMGPVFFQTVVGAVIAFEIALGCVRLRLHKKHKNSQPAHAESKAQTIGVDRENSKTQQSLVPVAPAILIIGLSVFLSAMAVLALYRSFSDPRFTGESLRVPGLVDVSAFDEADISQLDAWLLQIAEGRYPSLSVAVVRDGETVYQRSFGFEDIKANRQATPQTQYHVASVTKVFTASLAVILHERGMIDLDHPVVKYLPEGVSISTTPEIGATITLRQLASHTSGLPRSVPGRVQSVEGWYELEPQRLYDHLAKVKLDSEPGRAMEYSNLGFGLLGHALERAAGQPFHQLMRELVCEPLQLENTAIQADNTLRPATGYEQGGRHPESHSFKKRLAASGGLVTSVDDLAKFLAAQMKPGVFSSDMLEQFHTETKLSDGSPTRTALGWSIRSRETIGRILKKNGGRNNCSAWIGFSPEHGVGVAVITNCGGPDVDPIGYQLLEQSIPLAKKKQAVKD